MKKYFYLAMTVVLLGLSACGDDEVVEPERPDVVNPDNHEPEKEKEEDKITAEELAKLVTVNANYNESTYVWSVTITTSLGSKFPGKNIKYGIKAGLKTDMADKGYEVLGKGGGFVYATGNGTTYSATEESAEYYGMRIKGSDDLVEPTDEGGALQYEQEALGLIEKRERRGWDSYEEARYYDLLGAIRGLYSGYYNSAHNVLAVYVEIDGVRYNVKEQKGKLRLPWYLQ